MSHEQNKLPAQLLRPDDSFRHRRMAFRCARVTVTAGQVTVEGERIVDGQVDGTETIPLMEGELVWLLADDGRSHRDRRGASTVRAEPIPA